MHLLPNKRKTLISVIAISLVYRRTWISMLFIFGLVPKNLASDNPISAGELLRKAYETLITFESLEVSSKTIENSTTVSSSAKFLRNSQTNVLIKRSDEKFLLDKKPIHRVFLRDADKMWRIINGKAIELNFEFILPSIIRLPPIFKEYQRILGNPRELEYFSVTGDIIHRNIECYKLVYEAPSVPEEKLKMDAEHLKRQKLTQLSSLGASEEELTEVEKHDFLASIKRGRVRLQIFYISKSDYFNFAWEYYSIDGELLMQKQYDDYVIDGVIDKKLLEIDESLERIVVDSPNMYNTILRLESD